jgi:hypothetical protein
MKKVALLLLVVALAGGSLALGADPAAAGPNAAPGPCIRHDGTNLNELYGVADRIITQSCNRAVAGERWVQPAVWIMNTSFEAVPAEFVAAGATPLDDFLAKFVAVKYVVDAGTKQARTYVIPSSDRLWIGELEGFPAVNTVTLGSLHPLSVGQHTVAVYWVFNGMQCDGFAANAVENCFSAGETFYTATQFTVSPRN